MIHLYVPRGLLKPYIDIVWLSINAIRTHGMERVLPTGTLQLIFNLHDQPLRTRGQDHNTEQEQIWNGIVAGAHMEHLVIDTASIVTCLGVVFKPGGADPFFSLPLTEIRNACVPLEDFWGDEFAILRDKLLHCATPAACFRTLEHFLEQKLRSGFDAARNRLPFIRHAVGKLCHSPDDHCLERLRVESGYASTRFINLFSHSVGLTPKQFFRIQRFQRVLQCLFNGADPDWADIAQQYGYYDQAHFIHEFKAFTGITPGNYFSKRIEEQNHLAF